MTKYLFLLILLVAAPTQLIAQKIIREPRTPQPQATPRPVLQAPPVAPVQSKPSGDQSGGNVYRNLTHGFEVTFPENWTITGDEFGEYALTHGYDLRLRAPNELPGPSRNQLDRALKNVSILLTAYRPSANAKESAILRISTEDLMGLNQLKDAVDYFDLMRSQFRTMKLPADFKYSETQAEKLGRKQFAFIDTDSSAGKKRLYATVKNRHAIMFSLSYRTDDDLRTMRQILSAGNFNIK